MYRTFSALVAIVLAAGLFTVTAPVQAAPAAEVAARLG